MASYNMACFCLVHAMYAPSQSMRGESGHFVIYSHFSCCCHSYLVKVKINMTDITTYVLPHVVHPLALSYII